MKVILNQDIAGLGEEGDICDVATGYARNYLLPKKMAVLHTDQNLTLLSQKRASIEKRKEEKRQAAMGLKEMIEAQELVFTMPAGESGKLFGSVNNAAIATELEKLGITVEKKRIEVPDNHIRMLGNHTARVRLYGNEEASLRILVEPTEEA
jgi:large subunit ribosomal protein L9